MLTAHVTVLSNVATHLRALAYLEVFLTNHSSIKWGE
jgi:hypothetical protein